MEYKTFMPHTDLELFVNCYWTLEIQASDNSTKQRIIPDGLIEMAFILGDDIKRYTSKDSYILQPRAMVLGQTMEPFYIEPTGYVKTFAIRFYPYSLAHLLNIEIKSSISESIYLPTNSACKFRSLFNMTSFSWPSQIANRFDGALDLVGINTSCAYHSSFFFIGFR